MVEVKAENTLLSIVVCLFVALSNTFSGQFAKEALTLDETKFFAPYWMTYLNTLLMIPLYPIFLAVKVLFTTAKATDINYDAMKILKNEKGKFYPIPVLIVASILIVYGWIAPNYIFAVSLKFISVSAAVSINSLNAAMVFVLSILWLKARFSWFKACGVVLSIAGVVLVSMDDEFTGSVTGVVLILLCASCIAIYNTSFKKIFGDLNLGQVLFFLTLLGLANLVFNSFTTYMLVKYDLDVLVWEAIPWKAVAGNLAMAALYNISVNMGIAILNPLVVSIGILLGIPISAAVDILFHGLDAGLTVLVGGILISIGFCLNTLPIDEWTRKKPVVIVA
ncbi:unnamed protein product [Bursaphelenchus xylophilus]|uniref:(pine wood nematode) hypothetical protein n=1 Tax=Bursaphelenchus xylophilus TaxID=6326 RepID=A0A1I7S2S8_BURXY|nr:unnamed protein product [Bursaphelenchus xylophilus]CAG9121655.1 unnamed protein product [Bursaphelenchus xylophilus]